MVASDTLSFSFFFFCCYNPNNQIYINLFHHSLFFINHQLSIDKSCFTRFIFSFQILHYVLKFHNHIERVKIHQNPIQNMDELKSSTYERERERKKQKKKPQKQIILCNAVCSSNSSSNLVTSRNHRIGFKLFTGNKPQLLIYQILLCYTRLVYIKL